MNDASRSEIGNSVGAGPHRRFSSSDRVAPAPYSTLREAGGGRPWVLATFGRLESGSGAGATVNGRGFSPGSLRTHHVVGDDDQVEVVTQLGDIFLGLVFARLLRGRDQGRQPRWPLPPGAHRTGVASCLLTDTASALTQDAAPRGSRTAASRFAKQREGVTGP